jgi:HD superfamily phosphohydrolase
MIIQDRTYGATEIESEVILELIRSKSFQRLKGIAQFGIPDEFYHHKN